MMLTFRFDRLFRLCRSGGLRTRLLDLQLVTHEYGFISLHNGTICLVIVRHLNEAITLRAACFVVHNNPTRFHFSELLK